MRALTNNKWFIPLFALALVLALGQARAGAAPIMAVSSAGGGVFVIQGKGIETTGAMDITLTYDTSTLASPRVVPGDLISGALTAINDKTPGMVRMGIVRINPMQGSGTVATITFTRKGGSPGKILSMTASISVKGKLAPVTAMISNPGDAAAHKSAPGPNGNAAQDTGAAVQAAPAGTQTAPAAGMIAPGGSVAPDEKKDASDAGPPGTSGSTGEPATAAAPSSEGTTSESRDMAVSQGPGKITARRFQSTLDRFQNFRGNRAAPALLALFDRPEANGFTQAPPVALSDGKAIVTLTLIAPVSGGAPGFELHGARLLSTRKDPDRSNTWIIQARPDKKASAASLIVSQGASKLEYPLTVSPKIPLSRGKSGIMTDEDFNRYLRGKRRDLNGDGKQDYLDDYIAAANLLAARQTLKDAPVKTKGR